MWRKIITFGTLAALVVGGSAAGRVHTVRHGDTLEAVGRRYGVDVRTLAAANGLRNADLVVEGRQLAIPAPPAPPRRAAPGPRIVVPADRAGLRPAFLRFSRLAGVPSDLVMALAWQESGWQRSKVSSTRAVGVMQLMPDTVDFVSTSLLGTAPLDPRDPVANIHMGTRFVRYLLDSHGGDVDRALASYYQGLRSVRERGPLDETDRFVANVKALRGRL